MCYFMCFILCIATLGRAEFHSDLEEALREEVGFQATKWYMERTGQTSA